MSITRTILCVAASLISAAFLSACNSGSSSSTSSASLDASPAGQALLGPLINARVELYSLTHLDGAPLFTTTTTDSNEVDSAGRFVIPVSSLDDNELYIVKVSGGQDIDADDDGTRDATPTENKGAIHALLTGAQIRGGDYHVSILTEVLYRRLAYLLSAGYSKEDILNELDYRAAIALKSDINNDGTIDRKDIAAWQPRLHQAALRHGFAAYQRLQDLVHAGTPLGAEGLYPTDREMGTVDLSGAVVSASAFSKGLSGFVTPTATSGYKLQIIDLADPSHPRLAGSLDTGFSGGSIAAQDNHFYITNGTNLFIVDASDKDSPLQVGSLTLPTPQDFQWINVSGNFAYLTSQSCNLIVVDISQPAAPKLRGTTTCAGALGQSYYSNGRIFAPLGATTQIFDVSHPDSPVAAGSIDAQSVGPIYATATTAYVPDIYSGLYIVDVTDINSPSIIRTIDPRDYLPIGLDGNSLFADNGTSLQVYDISTPADPKLSFSFPRLGARPLYYSNGFAYQYSDANQLVALDLSDIRTPPTAKHARVATNAVLNVSVDHDRAYLSGVARGLFVVDVSDPNAPRQIDTIETPGFVVKTAATDGAIYTNATFDVTQLNTTAVPVTMTGNADRPLGALLAEAGNSLYSEAPDLLRVFDISQSDRPAPREGTNLRKNPSSVFYSYSDLSLNDAATLACATCYDKNVSFVNTTTLETVKTLALTSTPVTCRFHGNYVFVTTADDVQIIDASNPVAAAVVSRLSLKASSPFLFNGDIAYVSAYSPSSLIQVYDVSDPVHPALVNSVTGYLGGHTVLIGDKIYSANQIWDISDALNPSAAGAFALGSGDSVSSLALSGQFAYLVAKDFATNANSLYIVDVTDPAAPSVLSKTNIPPYASILSSPPPAAAISIAIKGDTAYISGYELGLLAYDIRDSLHPVLIGSRFNPIFLIADIAAQGNYAFVSDYVYGFHVLDFTDPASPTYHDVSGATGSPYALALQGDMLYALNDSDLQVIDITDPTHAAAVGSVSLTSKASYYYKVTVSGRFAYLLGVGELLVIDVSNPGNPRVVGPAVRLAYDQPLLSTNLTVEGDKLYIARGAAGVEVIDISDPAQPFTLGVIPIPALATAAQGDYLYLAGENGLDVVKPMVRALP